MQKQNTELTGILYLIGRAEKVISRQMRETLKPLGLTLRHYTALSVFSTHQTISSAKLAELTIVSPQAANELIKEMEERAWIIKKPDPNHGRIIQIQLTEKGQSSLDACNSVIADLDANMFAQLTEKEIFELKNNLKRVLNYSSE